MNDGTERFVPIAHLKGGVAEEASADQVPVFVIADDRLEMVHQPDGRAVALQRFLEERGKIIPGVGQHLEPHLLFRRKVMVEVPFLDPRLPD